MASETMSLFLEMHVTNRGWGGCLRPYARKTATSPQWRRGGDPFSGVSTQRHPKSWPSQNKAPGGAINSGSGCASQESKTETVTGKE